MRDVALWVRTIGLRAPWPLALLSCGVAAATHFGLLSRTAVMAVAPVLFAGFMTMPLALLFSALPGETFVERRARERRQTRARAELARAGLTPAQYLSTVSTEDVVKRVGIAEELGVDPWTGCPNGED